MIIAIIPARGGSKRIKNKSIKSFLGEPVISYSIRAAQKSGVFDKIIVSTDSDAIADVARKYDAEVPFIRPAELSDDYTPTAPVLEHALNWLISHGQRVKYFCCIYPTTPLIQAKYIKEGLERLRQNSVGAVVSVTSYEHPVLRSFIINKEGFLEFFFKDHELIQSGDVEATRSNDLPEAYYDAGQFYWLDARLFQETPKIFNPLDSMPIIIPRYLVQDIDTIEDWVTSEIIYETCKRKGLL